MSDSTLHILDPWRLPYIETVDIFIEALHRQIGPKHPLYRREVYPVAVRRDPDAAIYETDDEPKIYALVFLSLSPSAIKRKRGRDPQTVILADWEAIQARMHDDNAAWLAQFR